MRAVIALSVVLAACGGSAPEPAAETPAADAPFVVTDAYESILAKADAHDGTVDHVVSECSMCGLSMEGDPANAATVGDYQVHMCSASCKEMFESDVGGTLDRIGELVN